MPLELGDGGVRAAEVDGGAEDEDVRGEERGFRRLGVGEGGAEEFEGEGEGEVGACGVAGEDGRFVCVGGGAQEGREELEELRDGVWGGVFGRQRVGDQREGGVGQVGGEVRDEGPVVCRRGHAPAAAGEIVDALLARLLHAGLLDVDVLFRRAVVDVDVVDFAFDDVAAPRSGFGDLQLWRAGWEFALDVGDFGAEGAYAGVQDVHQ